MTIEYRDNPGVETTVDVLIAGAGACGLAAALAASDAGAPTLVLERDAAPFGSTGMSYGAICAAGTSLQTAAGVNDAPELLEEDILTTTRGLTDPSLARLIAREAAPTIEWLVGQHDLTLSVETSWTGMGHRHPRLHAPHDRSGQTLMSMLQAAAARAGADVATNARVTRLIADRSHRILGVIVERPDGRTEEIGCGALILATCGFGANRELVAANMPAVAGARYYGHESNEGDGILWGQALGAATADMGSYQALGSLADPQAIVIPHTILIGGGIQVNKLGKRFENELENISGQALTILEQPGGVCWMVYDERRHQAALERFQEYRDAAAVGAPKTADSIEALADACRLPAGALAATLAEADKLAAENARDAWGRVFRADQRLEAPWYGIRVTGALFHTQGGLVVNDEARVVTTDGEVLPNLFAGGGTARSVSGPAEWGYLPGMGLCTAVTLGRLAGQAAAAQVLP